MTDAEHIAALELEVAELTACRARQAGLIVRLWHLRERQGKRIERQAKRIAVQQGIIDHQRQPEQMTRRQRAEQEFNEVSK